MDTAGVFFTNMRTRQTRNLVWKMAALLKAAGLHVSTVVDADDRYLVTATKER